MCFEQALLLELLFLLLEWNLSRLLGFDFSLCDDLVSHVEWVVFHILQLIFKLLYLLKIVRILLLQSLDLACVFHYSFYHLLDHFLFDLDLRCGILWCVCVASNKLCDVHGFLSLFTLQLFYLCFEWFDLLVEGLDFGLMVELRLLKVTWYDLVLGFLVLLSRLEGVSECANRCLIIPDRFLMHITLAAELLVFLPEVTELNVCIGGEDTIRWCTFIERTDLISVQCGTRWQIVYWACFYIDWDTRWRCHLNTFIGSGYLWNGSSTVAMYRNVTKSLVTSHWHDLATVFLWKRRRGSLISVRSIDFSL